MFTGVLAVHAVRALLLALRVFMGASTPLFRQVVVILSTAPKNDQFMADLAARCARPKR